MKLNLTADNHLFTLSEEMNQVTQPLFNHSEIDLFYYLRYYDNNEIIVLTTYSDWNQAVIKSGALTPRETLLNITNRKNSRENYLHNSCYYLPKKNDPKADVLEKKYGVGSKIVLVDKQKKFIECFCFASRKMKNLIPFYFTNWDDLITFKHYFLDVSKVLIEKAKQTKILLPSNEKLTVEKNSNLSEDSCHSHLHQILKPRRYYILCDDTRIMITLREFNCLQCLARGKTLKETGKQLGISARTAEDYCNRLKSKLGIHTKSQLIDLYLSTELKIL